MKRTFILAVSLFTSSFFVYAQSSDEKAIQKQLDEIELDAKKGDYEHQSSFYADDMVFIGNDGKLYTKADRIAHMKTTPHPEVFAFENRHIRVFGNTAVVNTDLRIKGNGREEETHVTTIVLVKRNGQWKQVNVQGTRKGTGP